MKKLLLPVILLLCGANFLNAQNTFPSSGNAGIGTTTPTTQLEVKGITKTDTLLFPDGTFQTTATRDSVQLLKVGKNSLVVTEKGAMRDDGELRIQTADTVTQVTCIIIPPTSGQQGGGSMICDSSTVIFSPNDNNTIINAGNIGKVGIGTFSPSEKLTVEGTIQSTLGGFKFPDGTVQTTAGVQQNSSATFSSVAVSNLTGTGDRILAADASGNLKISSFVPLAASWEVQGNTIAPNDFIGTLNTADLIFKTDVTANPTTAEKMRITSIGNVGIGTTTPYKMLTVNGDVSLANYNTSGGGNPGDGFSGLEILGMDQQPTRRGIGLDPDPNGSFNFYINSNQGPSAFNFKNGYFSPAKTLMTIDGITGNAGIGLSTPNNTPKEKLQIGNAFAFHDGGTEAIFHNAYFDGTNDVTLINGYANAIRFNSDPSDPISGGKMIFQTSGVLPVHTNGQINWIDAVVITNDGKVGIGNSSPYKKLTVQGDVSLVNYDANNNYQVLNSFEILGNNAVPTRRGISVDNDPNGDVNFYIHSFQSPSAFNFKNGNGNTTLMVIGANGQVRIGTQKPTGAHSNAMLSVGGKFVSQEFYVTKLADWADYVLEKDHKRKTYEEREKSLRKNKHLDGLKSGNDIITNGLDVPETMKGITMNVEELWLDVIDLHKSNQKLQDENIILKEQLKLFSKRIEKLEKEQ
ncbi:MAG: hypothetical protein HY841_10060 [Bacteroidetes bacterium]|nr:hypothetical protein [Bacteroidota bacterium]